jgi:hypothetical protein
MWKSTFFMDFHDFPLFNRVQFFKINMFNTTGPKFKSANLAFFYSSIPYPFFGLWSSPSQLDIFIEFLYLHSLPGILHPCCTRCPHQHGQKWHFTPWLHSLSSIAINLFSLTIIIMQLTKHVTQRKIQCFMPYSHKSCVLHAKNHISLPRYYGSTC